MRPHQQFLEIVHANADRDRQTDGTPQRIATTHPIPKLEHVLGGDPKLANFSLIRRQSHEMLGNMRCIACCLKKPSPRRMRVRQCFLSRKSFRRDDEQRCFRIEFSQRLGNVRSIDVRDEMNVEIATAVRLKSLGHHHGPQITAANANIVLTPNGTGNVNTPANVSVTGNVQAGNIRTAGVVSATGNITGNYVLGNGSQLTGISSGNSSINITVTSITANYTIATGQNGLSVGPMNTGNNVQVSIADGQRWIIL